MNELTSFQIFSVNLDGKKWNQMQPHLLKKFYS